MSIKNYMKPHAPADPAADARDIEDALRLVERLIGDRYPMARPFLGRYRDDARRILAQLRARWRDGAG